MAGCLGGIVRTPESSGLPGRECLDWLLIMNRRQLEAILAEYVEHYNGHRPHRSLELRSPRGPTVIPARTAAEVVRRTRAHGLINEYSRQAASHHAADGRLWAPHGVGRGGDAVKPPTTHLVAIVPDRRRGQRQRRVSTELGSSQAQPLNPRPLVGDRIVGNDRLGEFLHEYSRAARSS